MGSCEQDLRATARDTSLIICGWHRVNQRPISSSLSNYPSHEVLLHSMTKVWEMVIRTRYWHPPGQSSHGERMCATTRERLSLV